MNHERSANTVRLLIIDDDDVDREKVRRLSQGLSFPVDIIEATSAEAAKECLERYFFDCVLLDYRLGDTLGIDLVAHIKSHRKTPCPIVMVTGGGDDRLAVRAIREGVYDYLPKGQLTARLLGAAIEGSIRSNELERKLKQTHERLHRLSMFDSLTGLPNRNLFSDRLEQAVLAADRGGAPFSLLLMDLDRFKEVNDTYGHQAGDTVLEQVAARLQVFLRDSDTVCRLGGDEFAVLLVGTDSTEGAIVAAEKIIKRLSSPIMVGEQLVTTGVSIGIAVFPVHGKDSKTLLANADHAMYRAKNDGCGFEVHSEAEPAKPASFAKSSRLTVAIEQDELFLHYQPKINLATREVIGVEALVRWRTLDMGVLSPGQFIPAAERTSVIHPMTHAVIGKALDQMIAWQKEGLNMPVAINLSARLLEDEQLPRKVAEAIDRHGLDPRSVTLEITETALVTSAANRRRILQELIDYGVQVSIDDFGTGYTSLKYLRDLEISEIKVDGLFVSDLGNGSRDASIVRSIATLAKGFGVAVVAECIEDAQCWERLMELGCDSGQGFHIGKPMAGNEMPAWLASWHAGRAAGARSAQALSVFS
jgi:diguanylate cyclase (GGDEF)-like protein